MVGDCFIQCRRYEKGNVIPKYSQVQMERHKRQVDSEQAVRKMTARHEPKITPKKKKIEIYLHLFRLHNANAYKDKYGWVS